MNCNLVCWIGSSKILILQMIVHRYGLCIKGKDSKILAIICTIKLPFHLVTQWPLNILLPDLAILSGLLNTPKTVSTFIILSKLCENCDLWITSNSAHFYWTDQVTFYQCRQIASSHLSLITWSPLGLLPIRLPNSPCYEREYHA